MLVLRCTGIRSGAEALARLCDAHGRVSAHYVVDEDEVVLHLVPEQRRAWHAGAALWRGEGGLDDRSIAIEVVDPAGGTGDRGFAALQMASLCDLCLAILSRHAVPPRNVVADTDIARDRRRDPTALFDWPGLARNGVGLFPQDAPDLGTVGAVREATGLRDVRRALAEIGYRVAPEGMLDPALSAVLRAFQRHWRGEAVTGQADAGTLGQLLALARTLA